MSNTSVLSTVLILFSLGMVLSVSLKPAGSNSLTKGLPTALLTGKIKLKGPTPNQQALIMNEKPSVEQDKCSERVREFAEMIRGVLYPGEDVDAHTHAILETSIKANAVKTECEMRLKAINSKYSQDKRTGCEEALGDSVAAFLRVARGIKFGEGDDKTLLGETENLIAAGLFAFECGSVGEGQQSRSIILERVEKAVQGKEGCMEKIPNVLDVIKDTVNEQSDSEKVLDNLEELAAIGIEAVEACIQRSYDGNDEDG
eukprot:TRINITY_DN3185_c0_g1_i2.p1 TRINITY_DN3185_c0_g1~~TRINITY_DN3185_c0_g1_i2.p1  ORF type:complete len:258 (-),score=71.55 TRINITY_DN3185_c0_g1_i2:311-1084(-)